ncbi:alkaline phosphatase family protein [Rhizocola hellebori]|uniref:Alkaline phosphatase family protein n=1 Tax=Rhizocola hellebori TaxID=1392758 RepID=A0A8J3Q6B3_9ACTN|nr:nucleotide pyrophosphatase/phosphodiesterase family protein [Rhizocola hellebori]GIH04739.1 alkaline phosphatase family protein [Rhizocola hellebori]
MRAPSYPEGTIADILPGCLKCLGAQGFSDRLGLARQLEGVRRIAVLLVDGMGWHQLPTMRPFAPGLVALPSRAITSGFPSTTPTSLVSLATGAWPGSHGVLAFTSNIPGTDIVLNHTQWKDDPDPLLWQPVPPVYAEAARQGIDVTVVNRAEYVGSGLTEVTTRGAVYVPADSSQELADGMVKALLGADGPALVYGYYPNLDKMGHAFGLESEQWADAASKVDKIVERLVTALPPDAALVVTADHGQLDIPADRRIDIDGDPRLAYGVRVFAGEPRVRYLHAEPGAAADVLAAWQELVGHAAWIGSREEAIATGWYGPMDLTFAQRIGDVVVVCRDDWAVHGTRREPATIARLVAMHGSLTDAELDIPLIVVRGE